MAPTDTICALSSGGLPAGVAIVRLSGSSVPAILRTLSGSVPAPRVATYTNLTAIDGDPIDQGIVLYFPGPKSFTGEDCAEFQIHGGRAVVSALLREICGFEDCRLAEAGEFMRRAFLNGKTDLLGAEATADLISAETEAQRRLAALNATGGHAALYADWRERIVYARAMVEADLDFSDEGEVSHETSALVRPAATKLIEEIEHHLSGFHRAEIVQHGLDVVILGPPNVGKSSLLNALARRDVAIVSDEPGTTRDLVEVILDLGGYKIRVTDSAGIRATESKVEAIGIDRALKRAEKADLVLLLHDVSAGSVTVNLTNSSAKAWHLRSKSDLGAERDASVDLSVSAHTGQGLDDLLKRIEVLAAASSCVGSEILPWRQRHVDLLRSAEVELSCCLETREPELMAEHLRQASEAIGRISGSVDVEDLLGVIFSRFCIGK